MAISVAIWVMYLALGLVIGYERGRKAERKKATSEPPIPDYDANNPINSRRGEVVNICGAEFVRMN